MYYSLGLLLAVVALGQAAEEACYIFMGDSHLEFTTSSLDISNRAHYSLKFKTTEPSGILLYTEGEDDYEGLFIYGGKLVYLLTNPSPSGVEGTTGGHYRGETTVNTDSWFTVEVWRNWEREKQAPQSGSELLTGIAIYDSAGNKIETRTDSFYHRGVTLHPNIFLGGIAPSVVHARGTSVPSFKGQIKDIKAEDSGLNFTSYSSNTNGRVKRCSS